MILAFRPSVFFVVPELSHLPICRFCRSFVMFAAFRSPRCAEYVDSTTKPVPPGTADSSPVRARGEQSELSAKCGVSGTKNPFLSAEGPRTAPGSPPRPMLAWWGGAKRSAHKDQQAERMSRTKFCLMICSVFRMIAVSHVAQTAEGNTRSTELFSPSCLVDAVGFLALCRAELLVVAVNHCDFFGRV